MKKPKVKQAEGMTVQEAMKICKDGPDKHSVEIVIQAAGLIMAKYGFA